MIITLAQNTRDMDSIHALGANYIPFLFITANTLVAMTMIVYKLWVTWLLNLPCVCIYKVIACMCVIVSIKTYISRGTSVVVCTDLSGTEPDTQLGLRRVVTSGSLSGVMISPLARHARDMGSIPIFITP